MRAMSIGILCQVGSEPLLHPELQGIGEGRRSAAGLPAEFIPHILVAPGMVA